MKRNSYSVFSVYALVCVLLLSAGTTSCVSSKKYKATQAAYTDTVSNLRLQKDLLLQDTTARGQRFRTLMADKNFLEEKYISEKDYLTKQLKQREEELEKKSKQLQETGGILTSMRNEYSRVQKVLDTIQRELQDSVKRYNGSQVSMERKDGELVITFAEGVLFKPETTELRDNRLQLLGYLTDILDRHKDVLIYVTGHTDNSPPKTAGVDNWELSAGQAATVVAMLSDNYGLPATRFIARGRAGAEPIASNETVEGRSKNRRITIELRPDPLVFYRIMGAEGK